MLLSGKACSWRHRGGEGGGRQAAARRPGTQEQEEAGEGSRGFLPQTYVLQEMFDSILDVEREHVFPTEKGNRKGQRP